MTPADKHRTAASEQTPRTDAWQDTDWNECGNDNNYKRMLLAYDHCRQLERGLSTANARLERLRELVRATLPLELTIKGERAREALRAELKEE